MKKPHFRIFEYGTPDRGTVFIFGGWRSGKIMYRLAIRDLVRTGWRCILFIPNPKLISVGTPYQELVDAAFSADEYVSRYIATDPTAKYATMGVSLGTLYAAEVTKIHPEITKMILSAPFGNFNQHVELWKSHPYFGKVLRSQPTSIRGSAQKLNEIGINNEIEKLSTKDLIICYADNDNATHTPVAREIINQIKQTIPSTVVHMSKGGHHIGIMKNYYWLNKTQQDFFR